MVTSIAYKDPMETRSRKYDAGYGGRGVSKAAQAAVGLAAAGIGLSNWWNTLRGGIPKTDL